MSRPHKCPDCGGTDVYQNLLVYLPMNTAPGANADDDIIHNVKIAENWMDEYWCEDCQDHPSEIISPPESKAI